MIVETLNGYDIELAYEKKNEILLIRIHNGKYTCTTYMVKLSEEAKKKLIEELNQ